MFVWDPANDDSFILDDGSSGPPFSFEPRAIVRRTGPSVLRLSEYPSYLTVWYGPGLGEHSWGRAAAYDIFYAYTDLAVGDFDGDGDEDYAIGGSGEANFAVVWGDGSRFGRCYAYGDSLGLHLIAGDIDADGKDELMAGTYQGGTVVWD